MEYSCLAGADGEEQIHIEKRIQINTCQCMWVQMSEERLLEPKRLEPKWLRILAEDWGDDGGGLGGVCPGPSTREAGPLH